MLAGSLWKSAQGAEIVSNRATSAGVRPPTGDCDTRFSGSDVEHINC